MQFEERGTFSMNHFDGQSVYTWNIDGKSECEILNTSQEMGNFCEAFGVAKIQAPSTKRKKIAKRKGPPRRPFRPKTIAKPNPPSTTKPKNTQKGPKKQKKPIVCYKCGKTERKSFQCKKEQKINELFSGDPDLK